MPFDPVKRTQEMEFKVMRGNRRRYFRFRYSRYYGGIVTADITGCNLSCAYCWNYFRNKNPEIGDFYTPEEVAQKLKEIARRKNCFLFRISGAEPILGERSAKHVAEVIRLVGGEFILKTNGLMFGYDPTLVELFVGLDVLVRVSVKGWDEESFEKITDAHGEFFKYQLKALEALYGKVRFWVAVMFDIFHEEGIEKLKRVLPVPCRIEREYLEEYPFVLENLRKRGIRK